MNRPTLARLESLNQIKLTEAQREDILLFFAKRDEELSQLGKIDTSDVEPTVHVMPTAIALREDAVEQAFTRQKLQAQAPEADERYWCVPRVIE